MTQNNEKNGSNWKKSVNWITGLTSVLLVIPAFIYSGIGIFNALQDIPQAESEKLNKSLYQKYFGEQPLQVIPIPIKKDSATYQVQFSIYKEGDIFIEYGEMTQWFPFPTISAQSNISFSPIPIVYASDDTAYPTGKFTLSDKIDGAILIRKKTYESGAEVQQSINIRTGKIIDSKVIKKSDIQSSETEPVAPFAVINLNEINSKQTSKMRAKKCITFNGNCTLLQNILKGELCYCVTPSGKIPGVSE